VGDALGGEHARYLKKSGEGDNPPPPPPREGPPPPPAGTTPPPPPMFRQPPPHRVQPLRLPQRIVGGVDGTRR
jgi:hypothetical protein